MNSMANLGLVHESEAQRQYARIQIPATLRIKFSNVEAVRYQLLDLSAGGFSFQSSGVHFEENKNYRGQLYFEIDGFKFVLDTDFKVCTIDGENYRVGCQFINLDAKQVASLRYLITSFLSGELVSTPDMLCTLSRDNFTKSRNQSRPAAPGRVERVRALVLSTGAFAVGLVAAAFVAMQLYDLFFLTHSNSAHLATQSYHVTVPRAAEVTPLVEVGSKVVKGQPIATFRAPLIEYLDSNLPTTLSNDQLVGMAEEWIPGTLSSPCDCIVAESFAFGKQYLAKGAQAFHLVDEKAPAFVLSYFDFKAADQLTVGDNVAVEVLGERRKLPGVVETVQVREGTTGTENTLQVRVRLDQNLPATYLNRPLKVSKSGLPFDVAPRAQAQVASSN